MPDRDRKTPDLSANSLLELSAIDMTLVLGADSFMKQRLPVGITVPPDPVGAQCLSNFIDLVVNSEACFLMLPAGDNYETELTLAHRVSGLRRLRNCAKISIRKTTERRIAREFCRLVEYDYDWLSQWFKAHWGNPVARRRHEPAFGALATRFTSITDDGWEAARLYLGKLDFNRLKPLASAMPDERYVKRDTQLAGGLVAYQYVYSFDAFRRGWQYAATSSGTTQGAWYCPHRFRQLALDGGSGAWLETQRDSFWSWGRYIVRLVETSPKPIEPEQVADWINGLTDANAPRWIDVPYLTKATCDSAALSLKLRELVANVEATARAAKIPRLLMASPSMPFKLGNFALQTLLDQVYATTVFNFLQVLPANRALKEVSYHSSELIKTVINHLRKGAFGYPSLISDTLKLRSASES